MKVTCILLALLFLLVSVTPLLAAEDFNNLSLTIYNQNIALIREVREVVLDAGKQIIKLTDIPSKINPTSVQLNALTDPDSFSVLEQYYKYEPLNSSTLLNKYLGEEIRILTRDGNLYEGYLSNYDVNQIILVKDKKAGPVYVIERSDIVSIEFPQIPEGLATEPALVCYVESKDAGSKLIELSYLTQDINWSTNYVANISQDEEYLSLNGWVTVENRSGASYESGKLKLIAGEINLEREEYDRADTLKALVAESAPQFEEAGLFEYHIYTLGRGVTLEDNQTKQISLLNAQGIPIEKIFIYEGAAYRGYYYDNWRNQSYNPDVSVYIEFDNRDEYGLGIPLPKGKVRVYIADEDDILQFIGEDSINHTPRDEKIRLSLGSAFDIVGERKIVDHKKISNTIYQDTYEITLKNHREEPAKIKVIERQWGDWKVLKSNSDYTKIDAYNIEFNVEVPENDEVKIVYTAEYRF
mgnify:FL=1